jgi:hypothetical protein
MDGLDLYIFSLFILTFYDMLKYGINGTLHNWEGGKEDFILAGTRDFFSLL